MSAGSALLGSRPRSGSSLGGRISYLDRNSRCLLSLVLPGDPAAQMLQVECDPLEISVDRVASRAQIPPLKSSPLESDWGQAPSVVPEAPPGGATPPSASRAPAPARPAQHPSSAPTREFPLRERASSWARRSPDSPRGEPEDLPLLSMMLEQTAKQPLRKGLYPHMYVPAPASEPTSNPLMLFLGAF